MSDVPSAPFARPDHVFRNADKDPIKEDHDLEDLANHKRGSRILLSGPPGCGKSQAIKTLIIHQSPPFDRILVVAADRSTKEYEDLNAEIVTSGAMIPPPEAIQPTEKLLVVLEDCDMSSLSRRDVQALDKLLRYSCTHRGATVFIACQDPFSLPAGLRRKLDAIYLWRVNNATLGILHRQLSMPKEVFRAITEIFLSDPHDAICIDFSGHPVKLRSNIFTPIRDPSHRAPAAPPGAAALYDHGPSRPGPPGEKG